MCIVSAVSDYWRGTLPERYPSWPPIEQFPAIPEVSRAEFDQLKREIEALKELLIAAKKFDEETGQPDCELEEKVELLRKIAKMVGVELPI